MRYRSSPSPLPDFASLYGVGCQVLVGWSARKRREGKEEREEVVVLVLVVGSGGAGIGLWFV
ncbi:hypothetical protein BDZ91DRAFT_711090, partial [Kalaharituber pfeilii]